MVADIVKSLVGSWGRSWVPRDRSRESGWEATRSTTIARPTAPYPLTYSLSCSENQISTIASKRQTPRWLPRLQKLSFWGSAIRSSFKLAQFLGNCFPHWHTAVPTDTLVLQTETLPNTPLPYLTMFIFWCSWFWLTSFKDSLMFALQNIWSSHICLFATGCFMWIRGPKSSGIYHVVAKNTFLWEGLSI